MRLKNISKLLIVTVFLAVSCQQQSQQDAKNNDEGSDNVTNPSVSNSNEMNGMNDGEKFLNKNKKNKDVKVTQSGLQYKIITKGDKSDHPSPTDIVKVHYEGTFIDGSVFDSSYERGSSVSFPLNRVIAGWTEGLQLMSPGDVFMFYLPSNLAYGERGAGGGAVGPNKTLIFKVELLGFNKMSPASDSNVSDDKDTNK